MGQLNRFPCEIAHRRYVQSLNKQINRINRIDPLTGHYTRFIQKTATSLASSICLTPPNRPSSTSNSIYPVPIHRTHPERTRMN